MNDQNAQQLLAKVMKWSESEVVLEHIPRLQLLADLKYDHYQRFSPGQRFIENLALWLQQFKQDHREAALHFVLNKLVFLSDAEISHLVQIAYPDVIVPERINHVAGEIGVSPNLVRRIMKCDRCLELQLTQQSAI